MKRFTLPVLLKGFAVLFMIQWLITGNIATEIYQTLTIGKFCLAVAVITGASLGLSFLTVCMLTRLKRQAGLFRTRK